MMISAFFVIDTALQGQMTQKMQIVPYYNN